jgi:hypothetical protein
MPSRVIHLIDSEAGNYQWPFKLGQWVWSKTHRMRQLLLVDGLKSLRLDGRSRQFRKQMAFKCSTGLRHRTGVNSPNQPRIWNPVQKRLRSRIASP